MFAERGFVRVPWYMLIMGLIIPGLFSAVVLSISLRASDRAVHAESNSRRQSELAFCQLLSVLDTAYKTAPPTSPTGQQIALSVTNLMAANRCP